MLLDLRLTVLFGDSHQIVDRGAPPVPNHETFVALRIPGSTASSSPAPERQAWIATFFRLKAVVAPFDFFAAKTEAIGRERNVAKRNSIELWFCE